MRFFKRHWDGLRGDDYDAWGTAVYYFEVEADGSPVSHMELYENGNALLYDRDHEEDEYGMMADQPLDLEEFAEFEIEEKEFKRVLKKLAPLNRRAQPPA
jgi:hypothetical protein